MTIYEVVFRVSYEGTNCDLTRRFSSLKMLFWCNRTYDVVEVALEDPEEYALFIKEVPRPDDIIYESPDQQSSHIIVKDCSCMESDTSVIKLMTGLDILHLSPSVAKKGWEYHHIIIFRHDDLQELMGRLDEKGFIAEILQKVPMDGLIGGSLTLNIATLFSNLTEKQIDALLTAHRFGYYRLPRKADVQTIAAKKRVARTTFSDNLKKAENKLVAALVPYIQLYSTQVCRKQTRQ